MLIDSRLQVDCVLSSPMNVFLLDQEEEERVSDNRGPYIPSQFDMEHASKHVRVPIKIETEDQDFGSVDAAINANCVNPSPNTNDGYQEEVKKPVFPKDLIPYVLIYIEDVQTLKNFTLVSKEYYDFGVIPVGNIVRGCLMNGGKEKKNMEQLYPLIKKRTIYPVSPGRLLALATGSLCEICKNTVRFDKNNSVRQVRQPYGMLVCWRCVAKRQKSKRATKDGVNFNNNPFAFHVVLDHTRTSCKKYGERQMNEISVAVEREWALAHNVRVRDDKCYDKFNYMWRNPYVDSYGMKAGPIMTHNHALILIRHLQDMTVLNQMKWEVERYFDEVLGAPSISHPGYTEFEQAFEDTIEEANVKQEEKKHHSLMVSYDWRLRKIANARKLLKQVESKVKIPRNVSLLHEYRINLNFLNKTRHCAQYGGNRVPLLMSTNWVHGLLRDALRNPTKYSGNMLSEIASSLDASYEINQEGNGSPVDNFRLLIDENQSMRSMNRYVNPERLNRSGWSRSFVRFDLW